MKTIKQHIVILFVLIASTLGAQTIRYQSIVDQLVGESPNLQLLQSRMQLQQSEALAAPILDGPTLEAGLYQGTPSDIGRRWDLSVSQTLPLPSAYRNLRRLNQSQSRLAQGEGLVQLQQFIADVQTLCSDIVYSNACLQLLDSAEANAQRVAQLYEKRMNAGDCSILDYNRAQLEYSAAQSRRALVAAQRDAQLAQLACYNGGAPVHFTQSLFPPADITADASVGRYVQRHYAVDSHAVTGQLRQLQLQHQSDSVQARVAQSGWLPQVEVGYASENVVGETYRGATVGLTLPLWNNQKQVRQAALRAAHSQSEFRNAQSLNAAQRDALLQQAAVQQRTMQSMESSYRSHNSLPLLRKALEFGQLPLESYLTQSAFYLEAQLQYLEAQHTLDQTLIQLQNLDE